MEPRIVLRTAAAGDTEAIERFLRELSRQSRRARFFSPMSDLAIAAEIVREFDPSTRALSVIAVDRDSARVVGHAIAVRISNGAADVSVAVADTYQHHGIGTRLLERVMAEAAAGGVRVFEADILADNIEMLHVFDRAGYLLTREPHVGVVHAATNLADSPAGRVIPVLAENAAPALR